MNVLKTINSTASKAALSALVVTTLVACGGGSGTPMVSVLSGPVSMGVDPATAEVTTAMLVAAKDVTFLTGIPELGTTASTTLSFSAPATGSTAVPFTMSSGGVTSKGELTFGSCILTMTMNPLTGTTLTRPQVYTIPTENCKMTVNTTNAKADGSTANRDVTFTIGKGTGNPYPYPITVAADGTITIKTPTRTYPLSVKGTVVQITGAGN